MNNNSYKLAILMMLIVFISGCADEQRADYVSEYNPDDAREVLGYSYTDAPDITRYTEYLQERRALESKYRITTDSQDNLKSDYEKTMDSYKSSAKGPVEFARNSVPELNQTIDTVEEQVKVYDLRIRQLSQELTDLGYSANDDKDIIKWKEQMKGLESTAMDLYKKREDLYITFRKYELNPQNDAAEAEYEAMIQEAQYSIERIQQSFKND
ncbi:hypothetical protein OAK29_01590 [Gammaproteobacteria bacterium]|nr:hypothetical protein [Gammaproteobacteria bacterium]